MKGTLLTGIAAMLISITASAQQPDKVGKMSVTVFNSLNAKGSQMVKAIRPSSGSFSQSDNQLLLQVAAGGQRQLALSQAVLAKVTNPQVKLLASSEVEEQTSVAAKLKEIAAAKGATIPDSADTTVQNLLSQVQNLAGAELDAFYINESGVKGHELLEKTMSTVNSTAKDPSLKQLATATLPVIRTHLTVSRDIRSTMGTTASRPATN